MKKNILVYLFFLLLLLFISLLSQVELDGIWGYGFCYNIASGLIPYKDFNMVIGPLYGLIFSIPMKLFGNYFYLFELEHILIYSFLFTCIYKKLKKDTIYILITYACTSTIFGYNLFCVTLFMFILLLLDSNCKYRQILIGILIGSILMVKHNIGLFLLIAYLYDNRKKVLNYFSILIPVIPITIYLIISNIFESYIDFCYLGMGNFLSNLSTDFISIIPYIIFILPLIKDYKTSKDNRILYILMFQILVFPIFDQGHIIPALIPVVYYLLATNNLKYKSYIKSFFVIGFIVLIVIKPLLECDFILDNNYLKYQVVRKNITTYIESYSEYIDKLDDGKVYLLIDNAYILRIYRNENPSFYDLINRGNLGSDDYKYIDMLDNECKNEKCYYILDYYFFHHRIFDQRNTIFKEYVLKNGSYIETLPSGDRLYTNKIK